MAPSDNVARLRNTTAAAALGAVAGALGLATFEAVAVLRHGGGGRAALAVLATAFVLSAGALLLSLVVLALAHAALAALRRAALPWPETLCAFALTSLSALGSLALAERWLSGQGIRAAFVALGAALGVPLGVALGAGLRALAARLGVPPLARAAVACMVAVPWLVLVLVVALAPGLLAELDVEGLASAAVPLVTALALALSGVRGAVVTRLALATHLLLGACLVAQVALGLPARASRAIDREALASRLLLGALSPRRERVLPPLGVGSGTCKPGVAAERTPKRKKAKHDAPDLVLLTIDALRFDHTTLSGYARDTTPRLARWAKSAAVFSSAFSPASSTRQTFRALFTGLHPSLVPPGKPTNTWGTTFARDQPTLAARLKAAGYLTVSVTERSEGFDPKARALVGFARNVPRPTQTGSKGEVREARARFQVDAVIEELRAERSAPLFAWTHVTVPHQPYVIASDPPWGSGDLERYDHAIAFVDGLVDRLLRVAREAGRAERTYVVVTSDHGQAFREHGNRLHGHTVYQEEIHVPFLVWGPSVRPGLRREPVSTLDLYATLLELASARPDRAACSSSLVPWLADPAKAPARPVYAEQIPDSKRWFQTAFVHDGHTLLVSPRTGELQLYDLRADPTQRHDLAEARPERLDAMVAAQVKYLRERGMSPASYGLLPPRP